MVDTLPPHHMYAASRVQFRDPFASRYHFSHRVPADWSPHPVHPVVSRALTPPPEMNRVSRMIKPAPYAQEPPAHRYGDYAFVPPPYKATPPPPYTQHGSGQAAAIRTGVVTEPIAQTSSSRQLSPAVAIGPRQPIFDETQAPTKGDLQGHGIAPSFQIPRSVNDSGGSLSELASQITCLFWFESAEMLQAVEDSPVPIHPPRPLVLDARPTTGFRKWVTTILSTTLVAQNVVLLALLFIYRLKKLNPTVRGKPGSEFRLLTIALMLGNKFLDDNTYTNSTWAEVSGIVVGEVHIMEVEFLSNMKYCLFTSAEDWAEWQTLLGKFAAFFERAARPPPPPAPILPPASSLHLPLALPSPPASNHASPPYAADMSQHGAVYPSAVYNGPTPAPSPLAALPDLRATRLNPRKRSHDDRSTEPPAKRVASSCPGYDSPSMYGPTSAQRTAALPASVLSVPSLVVPPSSAPVSSYPAPTSQVQQLPPLTVPARAMAMVYPSATVQGAAPPLPAPVGPPSHTPSHMPSQYQSRQPSPFPGSGTGSPLHGGASSALSLHPPIQVSPTYFLQQRNSPYRPVHHVSTLLYPPPSTAMQQRPPNVAQSQMHYQPLGKSNQPRQAGRLPYVSQNIWLEGNHPMTPVHQWPFLGHHPPPKPSQQLVRPE